MWTHADPKAGARHVVDICLCLLWSDSEGVLGNSLARIRGATKFLDTLQR